MSSLKAVIEGIDVVAQESGLSSGARLALEGYRNRAFWASTAVLVAAIAAVVIVGAASAFFLKDPVKLKAAEAGLGLSLGGALILLRGIWKDWNYVNLLLILIEDASDNQIAEIFDVLKRKL